jgi:acyl-CoA thioesterase
MKGNDNFRELLGIQIIEVKDSYAKVSLKVTKEHTNSLGFTHGGAIFSLADCAFAEASNSGSNIAVAIQVSINYLRPSMEGDLLTAEAIKISDSKTLGMYTITVRKQEKIVSVFQGLAYKQSENV